MRGGASHAVILRADALPVETMERDALLLHLGETTGASVADPPGDAAATGVLCFVLISPSLRRDCDIRCLCLRSVGGAAFIDEDCGELAAATGLYAVEEGLAAANDGAAVVRIWDEHARVRLLVHVPVSGGHPLIEGHGGGTTISIDFPGGEQARPCLISEQPAEMLRLPDGSRVRASLMQAGSPTVLLRAEDFGLFADTADPLEPVALELLEQVRRAAAARMGFTEAAAGTRTGGQSGPDLAIVSEPRELLTHHGITHAADQMHCCARLVRAGRAGPVFPAGVAVALAAAARIPGTVVHGLLRPGAETIVVGHAGGLTPLQADTACEDGVWIARRIRVTTTAARLADVG